MKKKKKIAVNLNKNHRTRRKYGECPRRSHQYTESLSCRAVFIYQQYLHTSNKKASLETVSLGSAKFMSFMCVAKLEDSKIHDWFDSR